MHQHQFIFYPYKLTDPPVALVVFLTVGDKDIIFISGDKASHTDDLFG